jgi:hypothetical protein
VELPSSVSPYRLLQCIIHSQRVNNTVRITQDRWHLFHTQLSASREAQSFSETAVTNQQYHVYLQSTYVAEGL